MTDGLTPRPEKLDIDEQPFLDATAEAKSTFGRFNLAIIGSSGSGKSTLMNILGCLDRPSSGRYAFDGQDVGRLAPDDLARLRRDHFGFIFQRYHLLGDLDARGNVEVPAVYAGVPAEAMNTASGLVAITFSAWPVALVSERA